MRSCHCPGENDDLPSEPPTERHLAIANTLQESKKALTYSRLLNFIYKLDRNSQSTDRTHSSASVLAQVHPLSDRLHTDS